MIKCHIKKSGIVLVRAKGTASELVPEVGEIILEIYRSIHKKSPEAAKQFRNRLIGLLLDPKSPVWEEETK